MSRGRYERRYEGGSADLVGDQLNRALLGVSFSGSMGDFRSCWVRTGVVSRGRSERRYEGVDLVGDQLNRFFFGDFGGGFSFSEFGSCGERGFVSRGGLNTPKLKLIRFSFGCSFRCCIVEFGCVGLESADFVESGVREEVEAESKNPNCKLNRFTF